MIYYKDIPWPIVVHHTTLHNNTSHSAHPYYTTTPHYHKQHALHLTLHQSIPLLHNTTPHHHPRPPYATPPHYSTTADHQIHHPTPPLHNKHHYTQLCIPTAVVYMKCDIKPQASANNAVFNALVTRDALSIAVALKPAHFRTTLPQP